MKTLLNTSEKRALMMLEILYSEERWWTEQELSSLADCSAITTYKTIDSLKEFAGFHELDMDIVSQKNKGILLISGPSISFALLKSVFSRGALCFQILDVILQDAPTSMNELCSYFFCSRSTVYRELKNIRKFIHASGLTFDMKEFQITGPEHIIREFYYTFYWCVVKSGTWPFKHFTQADVLVLQDKRTETIFNLISPTEMHQFAYRVVINWTRFKMGKFLTYPPQAEYLDNLFEQYTHLTDIFIRKHVPEAFHYNEVSYLSLVLVSNPIFEQNFGDYDSKVHWHRENNTLSYRFVLNFLEEITTIFPNSDLTGNLKIIYKLLSVVIFALAYNSHKIDTQSIMAVLESFKKMNPSFFDATKKIIQSQYDQEPFKGKLMEIEYLLYNFCLILSDEIDLKSLEKPIHVKLVCISEPLSESYLAQMLKKNSTHHLIVYTSATEKQAPDCYDIYLSDLILPGIPLPPAHHQYMWDYPPSERDWAYILQLIETISRKNLEIEAG